MKETQSFGMTEFQVMQWAQERGIYENGTALGQAKKTLEEAGELLAAVAANDRKEIADAIGDVMVTLINVAVLTDMDVRQLLQKKEADWQEQLERERQERERAFALLERERNFADLQSYRQTRLDEERETIIPELLDLVSGNTKEEVEASIEGLKERSARILDSAQSAMQNARKEMTGTRITSPSAGPLETNSEQRTLTEIGRAHV